MVPRPNLGGDSIFSLPQSTRPRCTPFFLRKKTATPTALFLFFLFWIRVFKTCIRTHAYNQAAYASPVYAHSYSCPENLIQPFCFCFFISHFLCFCFVLFHAYKSLTSIFVFCFFFFVLNMLD